jgi:hypothetical protein
MTAMATVGAGTWISPVYNFTRPNDTTAYAAGDLVANNTTAGSVVVMSWVLPRTGQAYNLAGIRLKKNGNTATNAAFRLHFWTALPTVANGDNGALAATQTANYVGNISVTLLGGNDGSSNVAMTSPALPFNITPASGVRTLYGLIEATAAYTPAAQEIFSTQVYIA